MNFIFQLLTTITTAATTVFIICGIKLRWFCPDNRLPPAFTVDNNNFEDSCCAVCLNDMVGGENVRKLPKCGHVFHVECVDTWLHCSWTCPLCRSDWLGDNGGVMMGMITRVEKMVVQSSVKPIIEKLHGTGMNQGSNNDPISPPKRQVMHLCELQVSNVEYHPIKYDLIIPTKTIQP